MQKASFPRSMPHLLARREQCGHRTLLPGAVETSAFYDGKMSGNSWCAYDSEDSSYEYDGTQTVGWLVVCGREFDAHSVLRDGVVRTSDGFGRSWSRRALWACWGAWNRRSGGGLRLRQDCVVGDGGGLATATDRFTAGGFLFDWWPRWRRLAWDPRDAFGSVHASAVRGVAPRQERWLARLLQAYAGPRGALQNGCHTCP